MACIMLAIADGFLTSQHAPVLGVLKSLPGDFDQWTVCKHRRKSCSLRNSGGTIGWHMPMLCLTLLALGLHVVPLKVRVASFLQIPGRRSHSLAVVMFANYTGHLLVFAAIEPVLTCEIGRPHV